MIDLEAEEAVNTILIKTLEQVGIDENEQKEHGVENSTVVVFPSYKLAVHMGSCFVHKDLIPRVGKAEAAKFPITKSGPTEDLCEKLNAIVGITKPNPEKETWFLIPNSRFIEFFDYLTKRYQKINPGVKICDRRSPQQ